MAKIELRQYVPEPTARRFHASDEFVRGVLGPVGSGKTVICCMETFTRAVEQPPGKDGVRRSRWAFIRNSYPELIATTMNTWKDWIPEKLPNGQPFCPIRRTAPMVATIDNLPLGDGTMLHLEVHFLALDKDDDVRKLKSLELTGAFLNEASELSEEVLKMATSRVGRYPAKVDGGGGWSGIIMDTNPPDDTHWWYRLAEVDKPEFYKFYRQPPAMIPRRVKEVIDNSEVETIEWAPNQGQDPRYPAAENIQNHKLGFTYYIRLVTGKDYEWNKVYVMGEYGTIVTGRPVYPEFSQALHTAKTELGPLKGVPVLVGLDYGLNHSAVFLQMIPSGQVRILDEIVTENCGTQRFCDEFLRPMVNSSKYAGCTFEYTGDPAGSQRSTTDESTCISTLRENGFYVDEAVTNNFLARREAVALMLSRMVEGKPGCLVSPSCPTVTKGFLGGYNYRKMRTGGVDGRFAAQPDKNIYSHPHDALQYAALKLRLGSTGIHEDPFSGGRVITDQSNRERRRVKKVDSSGWT